MSASPPPLPPLLVQFNSIDCSPSDPSKCCAVGEVRHVLLEPSPSGTALSLLLLSLPRVLMTRQCVCPCVSAGIPRWLLLRLSHSLHPGRWLHMVCMPMLMCVRACVCCRVCPCVSRCVCPCVCTLVCMSQCLHFVQGSTSVFVSLRASVCVCLLV
jgi:hypothetical protein